MRTLIVIVLSVLCAGFDVSAQPTSYRQHYSIINPDRSPAYDATIASELSGSAHHTVFLIRSASGVRWAVERTASFAAASEVLTFTNLDTGVVLRSHAQLPVTGGSSKEVKERLRALTPSDKTKTKIELQVAGRQIRFVESEALSRAGHEGVRNRLLAAMPVREVEGLAELARLLALPQFRFSACRALEPLLPYGDNRCSPESEYAIATVPADCSFDASMGLPCSDAQKKAVSAGIKRGAPLRRY